MKLKKIRVEYNPYFDQYLHKLNPDDSIDSRLRYNLKEVYNFFDNIDQETFKFTYSNHKWTISKILQHISDTERIFAYRALKIVREENSFINGYSHESYAKNYSRIVSKSNLLDDYHNNRKASISLFNTFDDGALLKFVNQDPYKFKAGLIPFIFCGHELHHIELIEKKYLS